MPFHFGQVFETDDGRQAIVLHIRNDGHEGLVRFVDTIEPGPDTSFGVQYPIETGSL